jgi:hypothetical protein
MSYRLLLLTLLGTCSYGLSWAADVPVPNGSFEQLQGDQPVGWQLSLNEGATGRLSVTGDLAHGGQRSLIIEKTNGLGFLMLSSAQPIPVQPKTPYEAVVQLRVSEAEYGVRTYWANQDNDAQGKALYPVWFSPYHEWLPRFLPEGQWLAHNARWTANPTAAGLTLRFIITGNRIKLALDDVVLTSNPPTAYNPAQTNSSEKPYDEARSLANLAQRTAQPARLRMVSNRPLFDIGGRLYPPLIHNGSYYSPLNSRFGNFGARGVHLHTVTIHVGPLPSQTSIWDNYPGAPDFSRVRRALLQVIGADPQAQVLLYPRVDMPRQWGIDHPDDVWMNENHIRDVGVGCAPVHIGELKGPQEWYPQSYGSPAYLHDAGAVLTQLGQWLKTEAVGKIVVGFVIGAGSDGQFFGWGADQHLDHSPGNVAGFRLWLREIYGGDVRRLQAAWGDPNVTFETADIAKDAQRQSTKGLCLQATGADRQAVDSNQYGCIAPARAQRFFARTLKQALGRPAVALTYYNDAINDGVSDKYALSDVLAGGDYDGTTAVQDYGEWRQLGGTGGTNASWGAFRVRGKLHIAEIDYRTYRSGMSVAGDWNVGDLGAVLTAQEFRDQVMRDVGATVSRGMGAWIYDMGGTWYDDPPLWDTIEEAARLMAYECDPTTAAPQAEMGVFVDEAAGYTVGVQKFDAVHPATNSARLPLNLSGVPYDLCLLQDLENPKLPDYKVYVLLDCFTLTRKQMVALKQRCRKAGKVLIVCGPPGGGSADYPDPVACGRELTGLNMEVLPPGRSVGSEPLAGVSDPLLAGLPAGIAWGGTCSYSLVAASDPSAKVLGAFVSDHKPALVVKRGLPGTVIALTLAGSFSPELLHNAALEAGIGTYGTPGQVTFVGNGVAVVHRRAPGPVTVHFGEPVDLSDELGRLLVKNTRVWEPQVELWRTAIVRYRLR